MKRLVIIALLALALAAPAQAAVIPGLSYREFECASGSSIGAIRLADGRRMFTTFVQRTEELVWARLVRAGHHAVYAIEPERITINNQGRRKIRARIWCRS